MALSLQKYEGLGNDYFVLDPSGSAMSLSESQVRVICDRHYGAGSDGILVGPLMAGTPAYDRLASASGFQGEAYCGVRILNPDGSEAEKSGNGLRIFAQWLYDHGYLQQGIPMRLLTLGGAVTVTVLIPGESIRVEMGQVTFRSSLIPVAGEDREVLRESAQVGDRAFQFCAASVGNPHCVVLTEQVSRELAMAYGPQLEVDPRFPHKTNVQFMEVLDAHRIRIEIWERGAGYTLASGSSSSAAAAVAVRLGLCQSPVTVCMPGGQLTVDMDDRWGITLTGPAHGICDMVWPLDELSVKQS